MEQRCARGKGGGRLAATLGAALAAASTGCSTAPPVAAASAAEVEAAFERFADAWKREDLEAALGAFAPDAVAFDPVPPGAFEGTEGIRDWIADSFAALDRIAVTISQLRVRTEGPVAWATARFVFEAEQGAAPIRAEGYVSTIWLRRPDGGLEMSVFHASHLPEPPDPSAKPAEQSDAPVGESGTGPTRASGGDPRGQRASARRG